MNLGKKILCILGVPCLIFIIVMGVLVGFYYLYRLPPSPDSQSFSNIVICHRGNVFDAPEDSLAAIKAGIRQGCKAIEMDVRQTKDNVLVLMHDDTLDRTTDGHGALQSYTYAQLRNVHILYKGKPVENIPTLAEALKLTQKAHIKTEISMWSARHVQKFATGVVSLFKSLSLYKDVLASSFYPNILYYIRAQDPKIIISLEAHKVIFLSHPYWCKLIFWLEMNWVPRFLGAGVIEVHFTMMSLDFVNHWKKYHIYTNVFTVNNRVDKAWFERYQITYQTDCLKGSCPEREYIWDEYVNVPERH